MIQINRHFSLAGLLTVASIIAVQAVPVDELYTVREIRGKGAVLYSPEGIPLLEFPTGATDVVGGKKVPITAVERANKVSKRMNNLTAAEPQWRNSGKMTVKPWQNGEWVVTSGVSKPGLEYVVTADKLMALTKGWAPEAYANVLKTKLAGSGVFKLVKTGGRQRAVAEIGWINLHEIAEMDYNEGQGRFLKADKQLKAQSEGSADQDLAFADAFKKYHDAIEIEPGMYAAYEGMTESYDRIKSSQKQELYGKVVEAAKKDMALVQKSMELRANAEKLILLDKKDYASAEQMMKQAIQIYPTCATYYMLLAEAQEKQNKMAERNATLKLGMTKVEVLGKKDMKWSDRMQQVLNGTAQKTADQVAGHK